MKAAEKKLAAARAERAERRYAENAAREARLRDEMKVKFPGITCEDLTVLLSFRQSDIPFTVLHEAGHVVMIFAMGLEIASVRLPDPHTGDFGIARVQMTFQSHGAHPAYVALVGAAGAAAERACTRRKRAQPSPADRRSMRTHSREAAG